MNRSFPAIIAITSIVCCSCNSSREKEYNEWAVYGGSKENIRYSTLQQIDTGNVGQLTIAWTYNTGDADEKTQIQVNPVIIDGTLYGVSPKLKLFALDAATGKQKWVFDPIDTTSSLRSLTNFGMNVCRGVTFYSDGEKDKRLFYGASSLLFCVDPNTGKLITSFADNGKLDLHNDLGRDVSNFYIAATTPGIIYKDMIIVGARVDEGAAAAPGHIRAYDVRTGKLRWIFHTIPQPGEEGYESWNDKEAYKHIGGANAWAGFSLDEEKGILFAPTGSASFDFYGGMRTGNNLFANCVLAIDANTGKRIWHFQTVHHDVWDRDLPTAPSLVTITKDGKKIEAIAQPTKSGFIFLFERATGNPIYPIEERPVPVETDLAGEVLSPTQPWPSFPKPFVRQVLTENDLNPHLSDSSYEEVKTRFAKIKSGFIFDAPTRQGTAIFPGFDGGAEWGGPAYDPSTGIFYVNANEMTWILTMVDLKEDEKKVETNLDAGKRLYRKACMSCHGTELQGSGNFPTLAGVDKKYNEQQLNDLITTGRRMMPGFAAMSAADKEAIASFVLNLKGKQKQKYAGVPMEVNPYHKMPVTMTGYNKFLSKEGYPAIAPPWGTLSAINLNTGETVWKIPLGEYPELTAKGIPATGTENYGGPVVTAGGVLFIAASRDGKFRAFNKRTGELLWQTELPAPGFATPAVYEVNGKQYVVIACGGGKLQTKTGDAYIAFALPGK